MFLWRLTVLSITNTDFMQVRNKIRNLKRLQSLITGATLFIKYYVRFPTVLYCNPFSGQAWDILFFKWLMINPCCVFSENCQIKHFNGGRRKKITKYIFHIAANNGGHMKLRKVSVNRFRSSLKSYHLWVTL